MRAHFATQADKNPFLWAWGRGPVGRQTGGMRVVAGTAGGRRLTAPAGNGTRPTTDRVREAVFNSLGSIGAVAGARTLDGFAGSGALGIEALSRGAETCTFVERDRSARVVVEANLAATGLDADDRARVIGGDVHEHLARTSERFDLVLLDPPHAAADWERLLALVADRLAPDGVVVVESDRPVVAPDDPTWAVGREKRYGGTVVQMLSHSPAPDTEDGRPR
ncbi:MAG TPA: 16S rRNA (guanine(966)-N(2))-methyltransferase RsmD [Iamia sp.]|nr:16S rRNA (guanine(966)-N(2))-methyltransferase RsmD [Iamia sp.]